MLSDSVEQLKGVGQKVSETLAQMDIFTICDLLFYFPYRYEFNEIKSLNELEHDENVTLVGKVASEPTVTYHGKNRSRLSVMIIVDAITIRAVMFNRAFAKKHLKPGKTVTLSGKWDANRLQITVNKYKIGRLKGNVEDRKSDV